MMRPVVLLVCLLAATTAPSAARASAKPSFPETQALVDKIAKAHAEILEISVHARPAGAPQSVQIASNKAELVGEPDDPEDLTAVDEDKPVVEAADDDEGWDVTLPLHAREQKAPVGAVGVVISKAAAADATAALARGEAIRAEIEKALPYSDRRWR